MLRAGTGQAWGAVVLYGFTTGPSLKNSGCNGYQPKAMYVATIAHEGDATTTKLCRDFPSDLRTTKARGYIAIHRSTIAQEGEP